ncbi:serine/threonine-protein kinase RIO3-like isoform X2 [Ostrea edulis]|nr:serine/threonine-protein kinase RIO3-like isoform X2 [Ostrea edulis]
MSTPWGKVQTAPVMPCSLQDVMSEQLAHDLHQKEEEESLKVKEARTFQEVLAAAGENTEASDDWLLAQMLQQEFDREHDQTLKIEEKKFNGNNKVSVSFENYRALHPAYKDEEEDEIDPDEIESGKSRWDSPNPKFNKYGVSGKGKNITTKHDAEICGRKNASKLMDLPPEFRSGDGEGIDMKLSNKVYNKLKMHSLAENKRSQRVHEKKEFSTAEHVIDPRTKLLLYKMVNNGTLESVGGSISSGKESVVYHAYGGSKEGVLLSSECAVKIYKTTLNEFKNRGAYVDGDHRFSRDDFKKNNPRKVIRIWGEKETANLNRMKKFGIPCPAVQVLNKHILVMSFIGKDQCPAPKLKDAKLSVEDLEDAYDQVIGIMDTMQNKCALVHSDLSEYNLLWYGGKVWVIDVSQAVELTHPKAMEFLFRDCKNVCKFFMKAGVHDVKEPEELFNHITGLNIKGEGAEFAAQVQRYDKERSAELLAHQISTKEYAFDYYFEKSHQDRLEEAELEDRNDPFEYFHEKSLQDKADEEEAGSSEDESDEDVEEELEEFGNADEEKIEKLKLG